MARTLDILRLAGEVGVGRDAEVAKRVVSRLLDRVRYGRRLWSIGDVTGRSGVSGTEVIPVKLEPMERLTTDEWHHGRVTNIDPDAEGDDPANIVGGSGESWEEGLLGAVRFDGISPTDFEGFCFDLMSETGFVNVDWRKGTPKDASPSDRGRDIVAQLPRADVDGHQYLETWFVDCKHYERGVPPEALHSTIAWAQAERPATVLFIASGYFTNGSKDWITQYLANTHPPFRVRTSEMPQLRRLLADHLDVAFRHNVQTETLRRVSDILAAEGELFDRLWYGRTPHRDMPDPVDWKPDLVARMRAGQRDIEAKYGIELLDKDVESEWAWGFLSGKTSLRFLSSMLRA